MRKNYRLLTALLPLLALLTFTAFSGGVAGSSGQGTVGAPTQRGGTQSTCGTCHNGGDFGEPRLTVRFDSTVATTYLPGQTYSVSVAVTPPMGTPGGYGFMALFLDTTVNLAGTLDRPGSNTQISTARDGRIYAEHNKVSTDSLFNFEWTAPAAGTGAVKLYLVGNSVNGTGGNGGDNGSTNPLIVNLTEDTTTTSLRVPLTRLPLTLFPNPAEAATNLTFSPTVAGSYLLQVSTLAGQFVERRELQLSAGPQRIAIDLSDRPAGLYAVSLTGAGTRGTATLVRR